MLYLNQNKCMSAHPNLIYDEACLDIISDRRVIINEQYEDCVNCPLEYRATVEPHINNPLLIDTNYKLVLQAYFGTNDTCNQTVRFDEHSRYVWNFTDANCPKVKEIYAADNAYLPILGAIIIFLCFGTLWYMVKCVYKCVHNQRYFFGYFGPRANTDEGGNPLIVDQTIVRVKHPSRVKSLDVFRGICITLMIFVNYGGGKYYFFEHSIWNGLTVADLVFPWFVWIMGMSLYISLRSRQRATVPKGQIALQIFYRSMILIFIGLILNSHGNELSLDHLRFPGVLQRLGIVYLFIGMLELLLSDVGTVIENPRLRWLNDLVVAWPQWLIISALIVLHTSITLLLIVPGCPRGYLGPGGLHDNGQYFNCTGGAAGYLDRLIFGNHMYTRPTCHKMYETAVAYDPEGLLGTLTAIFTAYMGVQAGRILKRYTVPFERISRWLVWAFVTGSVAGFLCNFSKNDGAIPVNKNLWSLSYALALSSMAFSIQALLHSLIDVTHKWGGRPFFYPGMNAILLYIGHSLTKRTFPFSWVPSSKTHSEFLAMNLWGTCVWVAVAIFLYKKNIFFKV